MRTGQTPCRSGLALLDAIIFHSYHVLILLPILLRCHGLGKRYHWPSQAFPFDALAFASISLPPADFKSFMPQVLYSFLLSHNTPQRSPYSVHPTQGSVNAQTNVLTSEKASNHTPRHKPTPTPKHTYIHTYTPTHLHLH